jgi:hypothetical protein
VENLIASRSGFCNFMHLKPISRKLRQELYGRSVKGPVKKLSFFTMFIFLL